MIEEMEFKYLVCSPDLNAHGSLHGGVLLRWADESSGMHAKIMTKKVCVTRFIDQINFISKANLGDIMKIQSTVVYCGNTSICFEINIFEEITGRKIAHIKNIIFVSVDKDGKAIDHQLKKSY